MNIFYIDRDPVIAAQMSCDKHVVKMILESAQMLCAAHRVLDGVLTRWVYTKWFIRIILARYGHGHQRKTMTGIGDTLMLY